MSRLNANTNYCIVLGITHDIDLSLSVQEDMQIWGSNVQGSGTKSLCELRNDCGSVDDLTHSSDPNWERN